MVYLISLSTDIIVVVREAITMKFYKNAFKALTIVLAIASMAGRNAHAQEDGNVDRSATLRYTWSAQPADYDPPFAKNPFVLIAYAMPVYDTLVRIDAKGNIVPSLATSWSFSNDGLTLTMQLRGDVKFSDGSDLNAAAVVKSLNRTKNDPNSLLAGQLKSFESFEAPNPSTVVAKLKLRDTSALYSLTSGAGMIVSAKALDEGVKLGETPVGSGPYTLVSSGPGGATYQRNDGYFDKSQNQFAKVIIQAAPDAQARLNLLASGQTDVGLFTGEQTVLVRAHQMGQSGKFTTYSVSSVNTLPLYLNTKIPPFDNPKVRMALNLAIDRAAISAGILNNECMPTSQPLPPGVVGHDPALVAYKQDIAKAKALLAEAGVKPFTFDVLLTTTEPFASVGVLLKAQLEAIGVGMNILPAAPTAVRPMFRSGKYAGQVGAFSVVSPDSSSIIDAAFMTPDTPGGVTPEFARAVEDAKTKQIGSPEREAAYKAISKMAYDDPQHVLVCWSPILVITRNGVVGAEKAPYLRATAVADIRNYSILKSAK